MNALLPTTSLVDSPRAEEPLSRAAVWLRRQPPAVFTVWAMLAAFTAYACMYGFRKPFSAAAYHGTFWGMDYKILLVFSQLAGYTISKFLGIKFVSEARPALRVLMILMLIGIAEAALILFALIPAPWNIAMLFLNGLPLGMVWGLVFGFLEGRRVTELMALGLSLSLIFSSGWVKAAGLYLMNVWHISEFWMPAVTGALCLPLLLAALWMLHVMPPPDAADIAARTLREPMDLTARRRFLRRHRLSLILLVIGYMCLMTYRDVRDTFQVDILRELGVTASAARLAGIETQVGIAVIIALGLFALIRSNRYAYIACCVLISGGGLLTGISTLMLQQGNLSPQTWMTVTGIGLYAAFVPYQAILFERLLASTRTVGTAAFLIALCDSYGYLSTIILYFYKALFGGAGMSWVRVLSGGGYALGIAVPVLLLTAAALSARKPKALQAPAPAPAPAWLFLL